MINGIEKRDDDTARSRRYVPAGCGQWLPPKGYRRKYRQEKLIFHPAVEHQRQRIAGLSKAASVRGNIDG